MKRIKKEIKALTFVVFLAISAIAVAQSNITTTLTPIIEKKELDLSVVDLVAIPTLGPYMLAGNDLHSLLEDENMADFHFPAGFIVDDVKWSGNDFVIKSENRIFHLHDTEHPIMEFDTRNFDLFSWDDKRIFIVGHQHDTSNIFLGNLKAKRAKKLLSLNENVIFVSPLGNAVMVVTSENIYLFQNSECTCMLQLWSPIRSAVMTNEGLMFATDHEVCLLSGNNSFVLLFNAEVKQLMDDGSTTYILLEEGDLLLCTINIES